MEVTDFHREWFEEIAGYEVSDEEIVQFLQDLEDYGDSLDDSPEIYRDQDHWT